MKEIKIIGLYVSEKLQDKVLLQNELTKYGNVIKTRIGLNGDDFNHGLIILELAGDAGEIELLQLALSKIEGLQYQTMDFSQE